MAMSATTTSMHITSRGEGGGRQEAAGSSPTFDQPTSAATPLASSRLKPKLRRVSKACGPCSLAHSACDRVRPCKRCVSQGKAHQCVDVSTGRRRGRPRRQSSEQGSAGSLQTDRVPKAEFDDEDSHRAGDEDDDGIGGVDTQPHQLTHHHDGDDDGDDEQDNSDDDGDDSGDDDAIHIAKRAHTDTRAYSPSFSSPSFEAMAKLLEEQRSLVQELRAMRAEIAQVRTTQSIHEKHFASIMPLLSTSLASNTSSFSPPSSSSPSSSPPTLRRSSHSTNDDSPSSHSPSSSPLAGARHQSGGKRSASSRRQQHTQPYQPLSSTLLSLITSDAPLPPSSESALLSVLTEWECPLPASGADGQDVIARQLAINYVPHMGSDAYASLPHGTGGAEQQNQRRSRRRRHDEMVLASSSHHHQQFNHHQHHHQQQLPYGSIQAHYLPPRIPGTGLYQKDLLIPSFAYHQVHDAMVVPIKVRLEMLSHLPFLSHYNITSPAVPFAITDPRQPIAVCRAAPMRSPGQEIVTEIVYVSPSFVDLTRTPQERLLGRSCTNFIGAGDDDSMKQFFDSMEPWVTMRSTVPCSPVLSGRVMVRRKDDSHVAARGRVQMFYNEQGYFVQCVVALEAEPWAPHAVQPPQALGRVRSQQPASIAWPQEHMSSSQARSDATEFTGATRVNGGGEAAMAVFPNGSTF